MLKYCNLELDQFREEILFDFMPKILSINGFNTNLILWASFPDEGVSFESVYISGAYSNQLLINFVDMVFNMFTNGRIQWYVRANRGIDSSSSMQGPANQLNAMNRRYYYKVIG